ncbi:MAG: ADP-ribosylation factor-like protein, partial [Candidatus Kariarchaeaceae archaeon]
MINLFRYKEEDTIFYSNNREYNMERTSFKVVLLGDPSVGKTSIRKRYLGEGFKHTYSMTLGADFAIKRINNTVLQVFDLAGNPFFQTVRELYYHGTQG